METEFRFVHFPNPVKLTCWHIDIKEVITHLGKIVLIANWDKLSFTQVGDDLLIKADGIYTTFFDVDKNEFLAADCIDYIWAPKCLKSRWIQIVAMPEFNFEFRV